MVEPLGPYDLCLFYLDHHIYSPDFWRVGDLITLLVSEDEGRHGHVSYLLCDPVHLGHHPVHLVEVITWIKCAISSPRQMYKPAMMTMVQVLGTFMP